MKRTFLYSFVFLMLTWAATPASSLLAQDMPSTLGSYLGLAPGCSVEHSMSMDTAEICVLTCGSQSMESIQGYYTGQLAASGFSVVNTTSYPGGSIIIAEQNGATTSVEIGQDQGPTMVNLTIDDVTLLGGAKIAPPTAPQAAQPEPQGTTQGATQDTAQDTTQEAAQSGTQDASGGWAGATPWGGSGGQAADTADTAATDTGAEAAEGTGPMLIEGQGLAGALWEQVTPPSGDAVVTEFETNGKPGAELTTSSSVKGVLQYYREQLISAGWTQMAYLVQDDGGMLQLFRGEDTFHIFVNAPEPGESTLEYTLIYAPE